jgi:hypothetical protein
MMKLNTIKNFVNLILILIYCYKIKVLKEKLVFKRFNHFDKILYNTTNIEKGFD